MSADDEVKPQLTPDGKFALLLILCELGVFVCFLAFDKPKVGLSACISLGVLTIAVRATWKLHGYHWYWFAVAISAVIQAPLSFYFPWSNQAYRGTALLPFGALDFIAVWGCIKLAEKVLKGTK